MNYAYLSHIKIDKDATTPVYVQLRDGIRNAIISGSVPPAMKMPSSRKLSAHFNLNRQTIIAATDELLAEGWLKSMGTKGIFVNEKLPLVTPVPLGKIAKSYPVNAGFTFNKTKQPFTIPSRQSNVGFDDGYADVRIAPIKELGRAYLQTLHEKSNTSRLSKREPMHGSVLLRTELAKLMAYRGLNISPDNILITQGSQMSIFLTTSLLVNKGDNVIVSTPNYLTSNVCFERLGAQLVKVAVDANGMIVDDIARICRKKKIKCVYITSHHHHPTTVTLSIERRLQLLQLAEQYGFAVIEDEYDYDFHYENRPLMPIASNDANGHVIYLGSFSKILSHKFRVGYIIAPENFINELIYFRKIVDRQGDLILQDAIGKLLRDNVIKNHIKKGVTIYKERRDHAFDLLSDLDNFMQCTRPEGGLAFWSLFDKKISLPKLSAQCAEKNIFFPDGSLYNADDPKQNGCRMGFASMNKKEMEIAIDVLKTALLKS